MLAKDGGGGGATSSEVCWSSRPFIPDNIAAPITGAEVGALAGLSAAAVVLRDAFDSADEPVAELLRAAVAQATPLIPKPVGEHAGFDLDAWREAFRVIQAREFWTIHGEFLSRHTLALGPGVAERVAYARRVTDAEVDGAMEIMAAARRAVCELAQPGMVLLMPTAPSIAPLLNASFQELDHFRTRVMRLTCVSGLSGLPQVTVPIGIVSGCPVGLSLIGWAGGDEALLDLAFELARYGGAHMA